LLGERLAKLRKQRNLTQQQVADKIHISRATYAQYEIDRRVPEYLTLEKLADFFEETIDFLVGRETKELSIVETEFDKEKAYYASIIVNIKDPEKKKQAIAYLEYLASSPSDGAKK
jgi:transcriptional regulator with XRE-family HTH domain